MSLALCLLPLAPVVVSSVLNTVLRPMVVDTARQTVRSWIVGVFWRRRQSHPTPRVYLDVVDEPDGEDVCDGDGFCVGAAPTRWGVVTTRLEVRV